MSTGTLKLLNNPAGFDVFTLADEFAEPKPAAPGIAVPYGHRIRLERQAQFVGSAEVIYEIDGVRQDAMETGESADRMENWLAPWPQVKPPFRLVCSSEKLRKKSP
jgi:hypothetical protein